MIYDSIFWKTDSQLDLYLSSIGDKLDVDVVTVYKLTTEESAASAQFLNQWANNDKYKVRGDINKILFDESCKDFLNKFRKGVPLKGTFEEYGNSFPLTFALNYQSFIVSSTELDESSWALIVCIDVKKKQNWDADGLIYLMEMSEQAAASIKNSQLFEKLIHKSSLYTLFFDELSDIALEMSGDLTIRNCSGYFLRTGLVDEGKIKGRPFRDLFAFDSMEDKNDFEKNSRKLLSSRHGFKAFLKTSQGERWVFVQGNPAPINNSPTVLCTLIDINEALTGLQEDNIRLRAIIDSKESSIYLFWNSFKEPVYISESLRSITGFSPQEGLGILRGDRDKTGELFTEEDLKTLYTSFGQARMSEGNTTCYTTSLILKNRSGDTIPVTLSMRSIYDNDNNISGYIHEISEIKSHCL